MDCRVSQLIGGINWDMAPRCVNRDEPGGRRDKDCLVFQALVWTESYWMLGNIEVFQALVY